MYFAAVNILPGDLEGPEIVPCFFQQKSIFPLQLLNFCLTKLFIPKFMVNLYFSLLNDQKIKHDYSPNF